MRLDGKAGVQALTVELKLGGGVELREQELWIDLPGSQHCPFSTSTRRAPVKR